MPTFDAVIVGARCAGAATAVLLARAGARVLVVDKGAYGSDTLSTHAMMRGGVLQLHRWGVLPTIIAAGTPAVRTTTFSYADEDVDVAIEPKHGIDALYAPRRALLDRMLVDAARASGVEVAYGVRAEALVRDESGRVRGLTVAGGAARTIDAELVIGADGMYSTVARLVAAPTLLSGPHAAGVLYSYWQGFDTDRYYWGFRPGVSIGAIPTNDAVCVFVAVAAERFPDEVRGNTEAAYHRLIRQASPAFADRLEAGRRVEPIRGFGGHPGFIKAGTGPGWALVGDAGYFKDPATAHGITDAFRDAELLARAVTRGTASAFAEYDAARLDLSRTLFEVTDTIASFAPSDAELQQLHRAFSREMSREVRYLAALEPHPCLPSASAPLAV